MIPGVDTVLLDLGGVLIDVDYDRTAAAFHALGHERFDALYSKARQNAVFDRFETGALDPDGFRAAIRQLLQKDMADADIDACWNAMLGSIPPERIAFVEELKRHHQVLLLSNTNAIHVPAFTRIVQRENGITDFKALFHGAYYSCEIGLRKPDAEAFRHVLERHGARPDRTLFIDDSIQHVHGALNAGLRAVHLDLAREDVLTLFHRLAQQGLKADRTT